MTPSKNRRKRDYANAVQVYGRLSRVLSELRDAAAHIESALLEPAIDALTDKVDESERVLSLARAACVEAKIDRAYGHRVTSRWGNESDEPDFAQDGDA